MKIFRLIIGLFITVPMGIMSYAQNGTYLILDGVDDYMQVSDHSDLDINAGENFTISMWCQINDAANYYRILDKRMASGGYEFINSIASGNFGINLSSTSGASAGPPFGSTSITDGAWHHLAMVVDVTSSPGNIICTNYLDGIIDQSNTTAASGLDFDNSSDLFVGTNLSEFMPGAVDDIRFWSYAMSQSDVNVDLTTTALLGTEPNLIASWDFEGVSGGVVPDITGNAHTGALNGSPVAFDPSTMQMISLAHIADKFTTDAPFTVNATVSTGLPIVYSILSGPATINGNTVTLTGQAGTVIVQAEQLGNGTFLPVSTSQSFDVIDLTTIFPTIETKLTPNFSIEMPQLRAYPVYITASIDQPNQLTVVSAEIEVDGTVVEATSQDGYYVAWWLPNSFGTTDVILRATGSNGNTTLDTLSVNVTNSYTTTSVQTFDGDLINFDGSGSSRWFYGSYELPQSIGAYNQIIANFSVTCPNVAGGCDDWDRLAYVEYKAPDGNWMELFRYLTPYGVACSHSIDVTDYASILHGKLELRMFIDTWGTGGWSLHMDFDYIQGAPDYLYSSIQEIWHGDYSFGNPTNLQPCDTVLIDYPADTEKATFRLTTTGHGWGANNTSNAAEFYHAMHSFKVNNVTTYTQDLWNDCNPNPDNCLNQLGTWQFNRAGWCPGTIAPPHSYDMTNQIANAPFDFSYIFQESYQDNCHPGNPNCVSGITCNDCNDGFNPFYRIGAYMISFSDSPLIGQLGLQETEAFEVSIYPNPTSNFVKMNLDHEVSDIVIEVNTVSGETQRTYHFKSSQELENYTFDFSNLAKGIYFVNVKNLTKSSVAKVIIR